MLDFCERCYVQHLVEAHDWTREEAWDEIDRVRDFREDTSCDHMGSYSDWKE